MYGLKIILPVTIPPPPLPHSGTSPALQARRWGICQSSLVPEIGGWGKSFVRKGLYREWKLIKFVVGFIEKELSIEIKI